MRLPKQTPAVDRWRRARNPTVWEWLSGLLAASLLLLFACAARAMELPQAVIAAMAICNEHVIANTSADHGNWILSGISSNSILCWSGACADKEIDAQKKEREDRATADRFEYAFAWEPAYQDKCKQIHDYVTHFQELLDRKADEKKAAEAAAKKAAEQPALDEGIAALPAIRSMQKK